MVLFFEVFFELYVSFEIKMGSWVVKEEERGFNEEGFVEGDMYFLFIGYIFGFFVDSFFVEIEVG